MSIEADDFFAEYQKVDGRKEFLPGHSDDTEASLVKKLITASGGSAKDFYYVKEACRAETGQIVPSLSWYCTRTESLPIWIGYRQVPYMRDAFTDIAKRFSKTPCYTAWEAVFDTRQHEDDRPVACAFRWPGWGDCVIHTCGHVPTTGTYLIHHHKEDQFVMESMSTFLPRLELAERDFWWRQK